MLRQPMILLIGLLTLNASPGKCSTPCDKFSSYFDKSSAIYFSDLRGGGWEWGTLLEAQAYVESRCNPEAVSPAGAQGIAQFTKPTWAYVVKKTHHEILGSPFYAPTAIRAQGWYMRDIYNLVSSQMKPHPHDAVLITLASYNAGYGNLVHAWKLSGSTKWDKMAQSLHMVTGVDNSRQTIHYVEIVKRNYGSFIQSKPPSIKAVYGAPSYVPTMGTKVQGILDKGKETVKKTYHHVEDTIFNKVKRVLWALLVAHLFSWTPIIAGLIMLALVAKAIDKYMLDGTTKEAIMAGNLAAVAMYALILSLATWLINKGIDKAF